MSGSNGSGTLQRRFYRVKHLEEIFGVNRYTVYGLIRKGRLRALKLDGIVLIPVDAWDAYIAQAEPWKPGNGKGAA